MAQRTDESAPEPSEEQPGEDLPLIELETLLDRPPSWRKRLIEIGLVLLAGVVLLAIFQNTIMPARPATPAPVVVPTRPKPPPALLVFSSVNYGTLTVNGKQQAGTVPALFFVHSNTYNISLDAPPFSPVSCHLDLAAVESAGEPFDQGDCIAFPLSNADPLALNGVVATPTIQLYISLGLNDLSPGQHSQIRNLLTRALNAQQTLTVPAGSYFATGFYVPTTISSQRASAPLSARGVVSFIDDEGQGTDRPCAGLLCVQPIGPGALTPSNGHLWSINVWLALRWRFSDASGAVVSNVSFGGDTFSEQVGVNISLFLAYDQAHGWTVAQDDAVNMAAIQAQDTFCATGENILQQLLNNANGYSTNVLNDQRAQGCEIQAYAFNSYQGAFLWRFGVLLAVDKQAHTTAPQLPMAPQAEVDALSA
ncbi:MAG TPA: hypothetical protein VKT82_33865 [Ktedonobacterales bacterium]|nr:hypothetical protein [Ktedonobacterales bacterium]